MLDKRTSVLLKQSEYDTLTRLAKEQDTTVSALIRQAVDEAYNTNGSGRAKVLREIERLGKQIRPGTKFDYKQLVNDGRRI